MNIVFFSPTWPKQGDANGIVTYCDNMVSSLRDLGHNVYVLAAQKGESSDDFVFSVEYQPSVLEKLWLKLCEYISPGYSQYYLGGKAIVAGIHEIQKQHDIDVMELEESFGWHYYVQNSVSFPVVMRLHGPHFITSAAVKNSFNREDLSRFKREKRAFQSAQYINAPSQWVLKKVREESRASWSACSVFYNPIEPLAKEACWSPVHYKNNQILFVGRFDVLKGADTVLKAFALVLNSIPDATLVFVGPDRGMQAPDGKMLSVRDGIAQMLPREHQARVHYLGFLDKGQVEVFRRESHVTIAASRSEVFGYTVLESLASSAPIIASSVGGVPEIIIDGKTGVLFESGNSEQLAQEIVRLLNNKGFLQEIAANGYKHCVSNFSNANVVEKVAQHYSNVIKLNLNK